MTFDGLELCAPCIPIIEVEEEVSYDGALVSRVSVFMLSCFRFFSIKLFVLIKQCTSFKRPEMCST